jgi:anti-anti-sigma factor
VIRGSFRNLRVSGDPVSYLAAFRVTFEAIEDACISVLAARSTAARPSFASTCNARLDGNPTLVDLANVSFIHSAGLRALLEESEAAMNAGYAFFIVRPSGAVRRLIDIADRIAVVPASNDLSLLHGRRNGLAPGGVPASRGAGRESR